MKWISGVIMAAALAVPAVADEDDVTRVAASGSVPRSWTGWKRR